MSTQPGEDHTFGRAPLSEHELSEVLVQGEEDRPMSSGHLEDDGVIDPRAVFEDVPHLVPSGAQSDDDGAVDALVDDDLHAAFLPVG